MPGGFHPFHAGHAALYNSARRAFPGAEVFVAATNDTSTRPFPFPVKEKLAKLAGVEPGHFVQVKSPFRAEEITAKFNPERDVLIFVRSEKDSGTQPKPGGVKKDGSPAYLQPLEGVDRLEPFARHAYMAYLPTVEFGPGMKSATEIRSAWPGLNEKRKTALVMSLYPATQTNPKLAANVVKMLDTAMGSEQTESINPITANTAGAGAGMTAGYQRRENQPPMENQGWAATYENKKHSNVDRDPELKQAKLYAKQHYPEFSGDEDLAYQKWVQRSIKHGLEDDQKQFKILQGIATKIQKLENQIKQAAAQRAVAESDYIEEAKGRKI